MTANRPIDPLTVKKYFNHIIDKNQSFLSASIQQRRLEELGNRISSKMELVELELTQLARLINEFKALEHGVKTMSARPVPPKTTIGEIAQRQLVSEIDRLEKMYLLISAKPSTDPKQLAVIADRIDSARRKIKPA